MLTDNRVLVECMEEQPALMCIQRKAEKIVPTEEDIIKSNIGSFGNSIGKITNRVTAMFELQSHFDPDSLEYKTLSYRICCGQLFQQDEIDKAKGIISKPMPKYWYDRAEIWRSDSFTEEEKEFQSSIVANKKPYFMRYVYPSVMQQYNKYIKNTTKKAYRLFGEDVEALAQKTNRSEEEEEFLRYYFALMPVGTGDSVMNRICRRFEEEFDRYIGKHKAEQPFDYSIMKSGAEYSRKQYNDIKKIFADYVLRVKEFTKRNRHERISFEDSVEMRRSMVHEFRMACYSICSNRSVLGDILIDICYAKEGSKQFCWDIIGDAICENLLRKNGEMIHYPVPDAEGDVSYRGERFRFQKKAFDWGVI